MKTVKKQGLTTQQKQYLRRQIVWYFYFTVLSRPPKLPKTKKSLEHKPSLESPPVVPAHSIEQTTESKRALHLPFAKLFHSQFAKFGLVVGVLVILVVVAQVLYPSNRSLPFSRLESAGYLGFADRDTILSNFEDFDSRVVTVHTHTKSITTSYKDLGVTIEPFETVDTMTNYPLQERLIPFSIFVKGNKTYSISRNIDDAQLKLFVENVIAQAAKKPKDASVKLQGTQFIVEESEDGYEYQESALRSRVLRSDLADRGQVVFTPTILKPAIATEDAKLVTARMQQRIDNPLLINAEGKSLRIDAATMASWVDIAHKPDEHTVEVTFNKSRVDATLRPFATQVDKPAVPTTVTYLNGMQAGRLDGSVGKVLQYDQLLKQVAENTSPLTSTIEASVVTVPPPEVIDRKYTKDSQGMQTLLTYWTANNRGEYGIDFRTVSGNITANINPHRLFPSVGVYRSYIASLIYGRITAGNISHNTPTQAGQTVGVCLELMMRDGEESCTNALGQIVGWGASDSLLKAQGFDNTTLTMGASLTTADDLSNWMVRLLGSNITTSWQADELVGIMSRSSYRSGIPAGSAGMQVANRFGSYGRNTHEMAIVYHPNGTYVLSILSDGSDSGLLTSLAAEINKVMDQ